MIPSSGFRFRLEFVDGARGKACLIGDVLLLQTGLE